MTAHPNVAQDDAYPWIHAYGVINDLSEDWLSRTLTEAITYRAPRTAVNKQYGKPWMTLEDITDIEMRQHILDWAADYGYTIPDRVLRVWIAPAPVLTSDDVDDDPTWEARAMAGIEEAPMSMEEYRALLPLDENDSQVDPKDS